MAEDEQRRTLTAALDAHASTQPESVAYRFLHDGDVETGRLAFGELRRRALAVAEGLSSLGAPGDRAVLLYPQGLDFIVSFFGCLYAGVIAVPASVPNRRRGVQILRRIAGDSGARWVLSKGPLLGELSEDIAGDPAFGSISCVDPERLTVPGSSGWVPPDVAPGDLAMLQYTSGSTGSPCGVSVSHGNLVDNQVQMQQSFQHAPDTVIVSWLPMFHDMGLGTVLMATWTGRPCILMSPGVFVQNPRRWLQAITRYRGTTSLAPDFAYDLCVRRVGRAEREGLDLSSWRIALNGSEPVRAVTIDRFVDAFAPYGFRRSSFHPAYGLAEATMLATSEDAACEPIVRRFSVSALEQGRAESADASGRARVLVSCGHPWASGELAVVHPDTCVVCPPGQIGEIWVRSGSVASGYWGKKAETDQVFGARTSDGAGPFLRTGDLGFVEDGHLFVTGRHKDLIIIRGRNHSPQDIEDSVSVSHPALVPHGCAAFSIDSDQGEQLVVVQEVARTALRTLDTTEVVRSIRSAVSDQHSLHTHAVVLLKPSALPRTTSGKVRRKTCRQAFLDRSLPAVASWVSPITPVADADADPDSQRRAASTRADRLIDWLRRNAADLVASYANDGGQVVPATLLRDLAKQGLLGVQVDPQYGGLGLGHAEAARVLEQLAAFDFGLALFVGLNNYLGIQPIAKYACAEIKALLLPGLAHGQELAAFAFEEPGAGRPPGGLAAQAKSDGEESWRLFGTKYLDGVTRGASVINVFARHEEPPGTSAFVVSQGIEGLRQVRDGLSIGILGFTRETISLEGVQVERQNLLGSLGAGVEIAREAMMHTRLAIGAACIGGMKRCAQVVSRDGPYYGVLDGKRTPNPVTLSRLGSVTARLAALECLVHRTAQAVDDGHAVPAEAFAACRILGPELLLRSVDDLMQLGATGGPGDTNRLLCLYRDAGLLRNFDGPPEGVAELTGAVVMEGDASLRLLIEEVLGAPAISRWINPVVDTVRQRMTNLRGALARRAARWGHTRAGELTTWLVLLAAVDGSRRIYPSPELERVNAWAYAQFEYALSAVRLGTPSETATIESSEVAATFAAYTRTIGDLHGDLPRGQPALGLAAWEAPAGKDARSRPAARSDADAERRAAMERELRSWIISWLARRVQIPVSQIEPGRSFADHGLDSVASVELAKGLSDKLGRELEATLLWGFATIDTLVQYLVGPSDAATVSPAAVVPEAAPTPRSATRSSPSALDEELARLERELRSRS